MILRIANLDQTNTYNLLTSALCARAAGRITNNTSDGLVEERFMIYGKGTPTEIMTAVIELNTFAEEVRLWHTDSRKSDSIWLEESATDESSRRALIYRIEFTRTSEGGVNPLLNFPNLVGELSILRHRAWESITSRTTTVAILAGMWTGWIRMPTYSTSTVITVLTSTVDGGKRFIDGAGTLPSRITDLSIQNPTSLIGHLETLWIGVRPLYEGHSGFEPYNPLGNGTLGTDATLGVWVDVDFATVATIANRVTLSVEQMSGGVNQNHYLGSYLVILKYEVDDTALIGIELTQNGTIRGDEKFVEETLIAFGGPQVLELGTVSFPIGSLRGNLSTIDIRNLNIGISAERISGTGNLRLYGVTLVPTAHFVKIEEMNVGQKATVFTHENDQVEVLNYESDPSYYDTELQPQTNAWEMPIEGGLMVSCAKDSDYQGSFTTYEIEFVMYNRWKDYRS